VIGAEVCNTDEGLEVITPAAGWEHSALKGDAVPPSRGCYIALRDAPQIPSAWRGRPTAHPHAAGFVALARAVPGASGVR
jgi:hypothetical protein